MLSMARFHFFGLKKLIKTNLIHETYQYICKIKSYCYPDFMNIFICWTIFYVKAYTVYDKQYANIINKVFCLILKIYSWDSSFHLHAKSTLQNRVISVRESHKNPRYKM